MLIEELPESERICKNCALQSSEDCALCYSPQHRSFVESGASVRTRAEKLIEELEAKLVKQAPRYRCPDCNGRGQVEGNSIMLWCSLCGGTGAVAFDPSTDGVSA